MSTTDPGTGALMIVKVGTLRSRPDYGLPLATLPRDVQPNHAFVIVGADKGVGRNGYVNFIASTLHAAGRKFAIVEVGSVRGSATRSHGSSGIAVDLISPIEPNAHVDLIDKIDGYFDQSVIISVPAEHWVWFARIEPALIRSMSGARPIGFAFVDPTGSATNLDKHRRWLAAKNFPAFEHRLVLRSVPPNSSARLPQPCYGQILTVPFFERQVSDAMFGRDGAEGARRTFATFHAA